MPRVTVLKDDPDKTAEDVESPTIAVSDSIHTNRITVCFQTQDAKPDLLTDTSQAANYYECVVTADGETVSGLITQNKHSTIEVDLFQSVGARPTGGMMP